MGGPALVAAEPYLIKQDYEHYTPSSTPSGQSLCGDGSPR